MYYQIQRQVEGLIKCRVTPTTTLATHQSTWKRTQLFMASHPHWTRPQIPTPVRDSPPP